MCNDGWDQEPAVEMRKAVQILKILGLVFGNRLDI